MDIVDLLGCAGLTISAALLLIFTFFSKGSLRIECANEVERKDSKN